MGGTGFLTPEEHLGRKERREKSLYLISSRRLGHCDERKKFGKKKGGTKF